MIAYIHSATIVVADQDAALDFYTNVLGWEKGIDNPMGDGMRFVTVVPPGGQAQLVLSHDSWYDDGPKPSRAGISLVAHDLDATYATLAARGVQFKAPVETMPWGQKATWFTDPDGNEFFVVEE